METHSLYFHEPYQLKITREQLPSPQGKEVLVRTLFSGVSRGTELLAYRGQLSNNMVVDTDIASLKGNFCYPFKYGYSAVGEIIGCGAEIEPTVLGQLVFAFQPHASHFVAAYDSLLPLPEGLDPALATLLPSLETAVGLVMDGQPVIGERVIVWGQGVIGLLLTCLLSQYPLGALMTVDLCAKRRELSHHFGATTSLSAESVLNGDYDLAYEVSGNPLALDQAINVVGYNGRVIIGSWYGTKTVPLQLGNDFHRNHIQLLSSQVSTLPPQWRGRWTKKRRFEVVWQWLVTFQHQFKELLTFCPFDSAEKGYQQLDTMPDSILQIVFDYRQLDSFDWEKNL